MWRRQVLVYKWVPLSVAVYRSFLCDVYVCIRMREGGQNIYRKNYSEMKRMLFKCLFIFDVIKDGTIKK